MQKFLLFNSFTPLVVVIIFQSIVCEWLEQEKSKSQRKQVTGVAGKQAEFHVCFTIFHSIMKAKFD